MVALSNVCFVLLQHYVTNTVGCVFVCVCAHALSRGSIFHCNSIASALTKNKHTLLCILRHPYYAFLRFEQFCGNIGEIHDHLEVNRITQSFDFL